MMEQEKFESIFHRVHLQTRNGDFVEEVWVMPFLHPAEVLSWGSRIFVFHARKVDPQREGRFLLEYKEGMLAFTVDPSTGTLKFG